MTDQGANPKKLFVGNLPFSASQAELEQLFSEFGEITQLTMITDKFSGRPKGFAFVEFATADAAKAAADALNGQDFGGRNLIVNEARPMTDRPRRPYNNNGPRQGGQGGRRDFGGDRRSSYNDQY